jgi:hypothetical protein
MKSSHYVVTYYLVTHVQIDRLENSRINIIVFPLTVYVHVGIRGWVNLTSNDEFKEFLLCGLWHQCKGKMLKFGHINIEVDVQPSLSTHLFEVEVFEMTFLSKHLWFDLDD